MNVIGIGTDIVECLRIAQMVERHGELFLLSVTNPASFDSRYFGPVSAASVIGVARPVWLESRP